ncbi:MAG: hypothetical protein GWO39_07810, partial [Gammaproteobacteria bacterium]|nr:hypothetical protein [Gammaproteobacteria bacterium]NIY32264.1 hypothetical protein [Gammaproteobacteria bacterium]
PGAVLHAKIALLCWQHRLRLIIASANLTEDGYRRNQEVFGVLDYYDGCSAAAETLRDTIGFLREAAGYADTEGSPPIERWHRLLDWAKGRANDWGQGRPPKAERVAAVFVGPGRPSAMKQLQEVWPGRSPPSAAYVVSPFFDPPAPRNGPAESLWELLRRKGEATVTYHVTAEETTEADRLLVHAPESLRGATPGRHNVATCFARVQENDLSGKERLSFRPLHAKSLWLENDNWVGFMLGSSNFTTPGLGLGRSPNLEANLVYLASYAQTPERVDALDSARLHGQELEDGQVQGWEPRVDETQSDPEGPPQL